MYRADNVKNKQIIKKFTRAAQRTETMKSLTTRAVKTHLKRHKVSFNVSDQDDTDSMATVVKEKDPLPIVELKPFVQKVWRREKSFANAWDRSPSASDKLDRSDATSRTTNGSRFRDLETASEFGTEVATPSPPPRTAQSLPSNQRMLNVYISTFDDFKSQKEHFNKLVGESELKRKVKLHPPADCKTKKQPEHTVSIIPGFITRDDRTKSTLHEISDQDIPIRAFACSPKALRPEELKLQQEISIKGEPLNQKKILPSPSETTPRVTPVTGFNSSWHGPVVHHGSPASRLSNAKVMKERRAKRTKTPLYDHLDRSGTLPSLTINAKSLKKRAAKKKLDDVDDEYVDYRDVYHSDIEPKAGRIENSLLLLSKHGEPTKVERQLTFELERNLSRFRRSKDYSPFEINPSEIAKYYPTPVFNMTQGEACIRQALYSNASKRHQRKLIKSRESGSFAGSMFTTNSQYANSFLKTFNEIDHIDSFAHDFYEPTSKAPSRKEYEDEMVGTEYEEPVVPYDTPRSQIDPRVSHKQHEPISARAQSEPVSARERVKESKQKEYKPSIKHVKETVKATTNKPLFIQTGEILFKGNTTKATANEQKPKIILTEQQTPRTKSEQIPNKPVENGIEGSKASHEKAQQNDVTLPAMRTSQDVCIDASGRTFLTSDSMLQVAAVNG